MKHIFLRQPSGVWCKYADGIVEGVRKGGYVVVVMIAVMLLMLVECRIHAIGWAHWGIHSHVNGLPWLLASRGVRAAAVDVVVVVTIVATLGN